MLADFTGLILPTYSKAASAPRGPSADGLLDYFRIANRNSGKAADRLAERIGMLATVDGVYDSSDLSQFSEAPRLRAVFREVRFEELAPVPLVTDADHLAQYS